MKQIYFLAVALLMSLSYVAPAYGQDDDDEVYSFTVEWDNPGAVTLKKGIRVITLAPEATSYVYEAFSEWDPNIVVGAASGWQISEVYYFDGADKKAVNKGYAGYSLSLSDYNGKTIHVVTEQVAMNAQITINALFTPKAISEVTFRGSGVTQKQFEKGNQVVKFNSGLDSEVEIIATADAWKLDGDGDKVYRQFYSIKKNGADVSDTWDDWSSVYKVPVSDGDVIEIQPTEVDPNAGIDPEDLYATVNFDFSASPEGSLKNIFCNGNFYTLADVAGGLKVEKGTEIRVNFNEDYTVTSATYAGASLDFTDGSLKFKADKSGTLTVVAKEKEYSKRTFTAYVVCPEGIKLANGNQLSNEIADLTGGTPYGQEVTVPGSDSVKTFTIPAGELREVTFELSDKYNTISIAANSGYWLKAVRDFTSLSTGLETYLEKSKVHTLLIVAKKIADDATAQVYIDKGIDPTSVQLRPNRANGASGNRTFKANGFNTFTYDSEYEPGFAVCCTDGEMVDNTGNSPKPLYMATIYETEMPVGGVDMIWDSENMCYNYTAIPDGGLVKVYPTLRKNVKVTRDRFAFAEGFVGSNWEEIDLSEPEVATTVKAYSLTDMSFYVDPATTEVWVDGVKQEDEEGFVSFVIEDNHKVQIKRMGEDPSIPVYSAEGGATSLAEVLITFPNAAYAEKRYGKSTDEIRFSAGDIWAPISVDLQQVYGSEVPTFRLSVTPAPTTPGNYELMIPADFFCFNYTEDAAPADFSAVFVLTPNQGEITYEFEPSCALNAEWTAWGAWIGMIFGEGQMPAIADDSKITVKWNGEVVSAEDYEVSVESNMLMLGVFSSEVTEGNEGEIELILEEGSITVNGQVLPAVDHTWKVMMPKEFVYDIPGHNYDDENGRFTVFVTFPGHYDSVEVYNENGITLKEEGYGSDFYNETGVIMRDNAVGCAFYMEEEQEATPHVFGVTFRLPVKDTRYTLSARRGTFTINGFQESDEFYKDYDFSEIATGVASVMMDMLTEGKVYNMQGMRQSAKWSELPAGMYIVNGKKMVKE